MIDIDILPATEKYFPSLFQGCCILTEELKAELVAFVGEHREDDDGDIYLVGGECYFVPVDGDDVFINETIHIANKITEFTGEIPTHEIMPTTKPVSPEVRQAIAVEARIWHSDETGEAIIHMEPVRSPDWFLKKVAALNERASRRELKH